MLGLRIMSPGPLLRKLLRELVEPGPVFFFAILLLFVASFCGLNSKFMQTWLAFCLSVRNFFKAELRSIGASCPKAGVIFIAAALFFPLLKLL